MLSETNPKVYWLATINSAEYCQQSILNSIRWLCRLNTMTWREVFTYGSNTQESQLNRLNGILVSRKPQHVCDGRRRGCWLIVREIEKKMCAKSVPTWDLQRIPVYCHICANKSSLISHSEYIRVRAVWLWLHRMWVNIAECEIHSFVEYDWNYCTCGSSI